MKQKSLILLTTIISVLTTAARTIIPASIDSIVAHDGLLPIVVAPEQSIEYSAGFALDSLASKGYIVITSANATEAIDSALTQNADAKSPLYNKIDDEYIAALGFPNVPLPSNDKRIATWIMIECGHKVSSVVPTLYVAGDSQAKAEAEAAYAQIDYCPIALASFCGVERGANRAIDIVIDWLGWMFKGESNKRQIFVSHLMRGYPGWEMESKNFLSNYVYSPMPEFGLGMHKFDSQYPDVHDPVLAYEDGKYYLFTTGFGIGMLSSSDNMLTWQEEKAPLDPLPQWAMDIIPAYKGHTWAPDIVKYGDNWYLYYSCSTFGKNISAIGVMSSKTLDPSTSDWHDLGMVVRSIPGITDWNAIDPNVNFDQNGNPWLTFGSFWDGIQLVQLDKDMKSIIGSPCTIARRRCPCKVAHLQEHANTNAIEAPFILQHDGWYYLFVSFDYCCQGLGSTYKTAVGRSKSIQGPYLDMDGCDMADTGGTILIAETPEYAGVGHCAAYDIGDDTYFIAHAYDKSLFGASKLFLATLDWKDGWPTIGERLNSHKSKI